MQELHKFHVPSNIGRIPRKIETGFSGFTADQFKNWVMLYSIPVLFDRIDVTHLECWRRFVLACRLLCQKSLSTSDLQFADALLMQFCSKVEQLYGPDVITPNMHMHGHLKEVILEFGPPHCIWLFAYERFDGILGNQPNNNKSIEPQLMKKISQESIYLSMQTTPEDLADDFKSLFITKDDDTKQLISPVVPPRCTRGVLCSMEVESAQDIVSKLHNVPLSSVEVNCCFLKYSTMQISGKGFCPCLQSSSRHFIAIADWKIDLFGQPPSQLTQPHCPYENIRPVKIHYFASISYSISEDPQTLIFGVVSWFAPHPSRCLLGQPAQVWCKSLFEINASSFVPYNCLLSRCAYTFTRIARLQEDVLIVVPIVE